MGLPVLLTVGALGVGFVALSKARANLAANPAPVNSGAGLQAAANGVDAVSGADGIAAGAEGGSPPVQTSEDGSGGIVDPNSGNSGADPTTSPSSNLYTIGANADGTPLSTPDGNSSVAAKYSTGSAELPKYQQSRALGELGPIAGQVW